MVQEYESCRGLPTSVLLAGSTTRTCFRSHSDHRIGDSSLGESGTLQKFFGNYVGQSISLADQGLSERDLAVTIKPYQNEGFSLDWTTITKRPEGKTKHQSYSVAFEPTSRARAFSGRPSAATCSATSHRSIPWPVNPIYGRIWAMIR